MARLVSKTNSDEWNMLSFRHPFFRRSKYDQLKRIVHMEDANRPMDLHGENNIATSTFEITKRRVNLDFVAEQEKALEQDMKETNKIYNALVHTQALDRQTKGSASPSSCRSAQHNTKSKDNTKRGNKRPVNDKEQEFRRQSQKISADSATTITWNSLVNSAPQQDEPRKGVPQNNTYEPAGSNRTHNASQEASSGHSRRLKTKADSQNAYQSIPSFYTLGASSTGYKSTLKGVDHNRSQHANASSRGNSSRNGEKLAQSKPRAQLANKSTDTPVNKSNSRFAKDERIPEFVRSLWNAVEDEEISSIGWSGDGGSVEDYVRIEPVDRFVEQVLPRYFNKFIDPKR